MKTKHNVVIQTNCSDGVAYFVLHSNMIGNYDVYLKRYKTNAYAETFSEMTRQFYRKQDRTTNQIQLTVGIYIQYSNYLPKEKSVCESS